MRSGYNNARVRAVTYTGEAAVLSWELQHSLCAAAGRATPGSSNTGSSISYDYQDKYCAYSPTDNHVVTDRCNWAQDGRRPEFTHVSGGLGGGVGYMCASSSGTDCVYQVRVEGTAEASNCD